MTAAGWRGLAAGAGLWLLGSLAGCRVQEESPVVRLRFSLWGSTAQQQVERAIVREFERTNPGIRIDLLVFGAAKYGEKLVSMMVGNTAPDVMMVLMSDYDNWASRGVLADLTPESQDIARELTLLPLPRTAFERQGRFYALPVNVHGLVTFVNLDAFAAAGIPVPAEGFTWDQILALGPRLSRRAGQKDALTDYAVLYPAIPYSLLLEQGGALFDDLSHPRRVLVASPAGEAWIELLRRLEHSPFSVSRATAADLGTYQLFRDGRVALYFSGRWQVPDFTGTTKFNWDIRPFPAGPQGRVTWHGGTAIAVAAKSVYPVEARRFAAFYAGKIATEIAMQGGRVVPVYRELAESPAFLGLHPPLSTRHFAETMAPGAAATWLYAPGAQDAWDIVNLRLEEALADPSLPAADVVRRMAADLERWLQRRRETGKPGA